MNQDIISIGISFESQMIALTKFIKKQKKNKTVIMFPDNQYRPLIEKKLKKIEEILIKTKIVY